MMFNLECYVPLYHVFWFSDQNYHIKCINTETTFNTQVHPQIDQGLSKLVGEAVETHRTFNQTIPTIGIAAWGTIQNRDLLISNDNEVLVYS